MLWINIIVFVEWSTFCGQLNLFADGDFGRLTQKLHPRLWTQMQLSIIQH